MDIRFFFTDADITLTDRAKLKQFITGIFKKEKRTALSLTYVFCSDEYLLDINKQFLQHDYYTDIITFDLSATKSVVEGEVYISVDRIRDNAKQHKATNKNELHRVMFHGVLHLCGYKDKTLKDEKAMRSAEEKYLRLYFK
jgi:probable rRNA maturation factor